MSSYEYNRTLSPQRYPEELLKELYKGTGEVLNLDNPLTYNAKIQWLKLYDNTKEKTRLCDKLLVRDYVRDKIGEEYLIALLGVWDRFDDIDFATLPNSFVLKTNHSCKTNIIVPDKTYLDIAAAKYNIDYWMQDNYACHNLELHYADIVPKIIAEEYVSNSNEDLHDYKVLCFNGKAQNILYMQGRASDLRLAFYDLNWIKLNISCNEIPIVEEDIPKPEKLELMIHLAETLAEGFALVRVDFYVLNDGSIRFGEMTFTPANGMNNWHPEEVNRDWGTKLLLPEESTPLPEKSFAERGVVMRREFVRKETNYPRELKALEAGITELSRENIEIKEQIADLRTQLAEVGNKYTLSTLFYRAVIRGYYGFVRIFSHRDWRTLYVDYMERYFLTGAYYRACQRLIKSIEEERPDIAKSRVKLSYVRFCAALLALLFGEEPEYYWGRDYPRGMLLQIPAAVTGARLNFGKKIYNDPQKTYLLSNKIEFAKYWKGFYCRKFCQSDMVSEREFMELFHDSVRLIAKPLAGERGCGIKVYEISGNLREVFVQISMLEPSIVEEYVFQTGVLHELNPSSLNTIRVITLRNGSIVSPISAYLRIGGQGSVTDNLHTGGVKVTISIPDGRTIDGVTMTRNHLTRHPQTDIGFSNIGIPRWQDVLSMCIQAHESAPEGLDLIGWDVCVDEHQLLLIEGNECPGFAPYRRGNPNGWRILKRYINSKYTEKLSAIKHIVP